MTEANVFEDQSGIRVESGWLRRISAIRFVRDGHVFPEGYGIAWYRPDAPEAVIAPVPWNRLIGWAYRLYWRLKTQIDDGPLQLAFRAGVDGARKDWAQVEARMRVRHKHELDEAYRRGRREMLADLEVRAASLSKAWGRHD